MRAILSIAIVFTATSAFAADKIDATKLIGSWTVTKSESLPPGAKATITYEKGGKANAKVEIMGMKIDLPATYKIDGDKLIITQKIEGEEKTTTDTITKLTDDVLITKDKDGKVDEFKKVKEVKKDEKK